jgi:hypothetical protein
VEVEGEVEVVIVLVVSVVDSCVAGGVGCAVVGGEFPVTFRLEMATNTPTTATSRPTIVATAAHFPSPHPRGPWFTLRPPRAHSTRRQFIPAQSEGKHTGPAPKRSAATAWVSELRTLCRPLVLMISSPRTSRRRSLPGPVRSSGGLWRPLLDHVVRPARIHGSAHRVHLVARLADRWSKGLQRRYLPQVRWAPRPL